MKKLMLFIVILLTAGFTQAFRQILAPAPKPTEKEFFFRAGNNSILVYEPDGKDFKFKKEIKITEEMKKIQHPEHKHLINFLLDELNSQKDTFKISDNAIRTSWHFTHIFPNNISDKYEKVKGFYFDHKKNDLQPISYEGLISWKKILHLWGLFIVFYMLSAVLLFVFRGPRPGFLFMGVLPLVIGYILVFIILLFD